MSHSPFGKIPESQLELKFRNSGGQWVWEYFIQDTRVGLSTCIPEPGATLQISSIHVNESFRKKGIGDKLMTQIIGEARLKGLSKIYGTFDKAEGNPWLLAYFRKRGFTVKELKDGGSVSSKWRIEMS